MIKKSIIILVYILQFFFISYGYAQDAFDEDDLFSDSEIIVDSEEIEDKTIDTQFSTRSLDLSGSIYNTSSCTIKPDDFALQQFIIDVENAQIENQGLNTEAISQVPFLDPDENPVLDTKMTGNFLLDARLTGGIKGVVNLDLYYYPDGQMDYNEAGDGLLDTEFTDEEIYTDYLLKEAFADFNIYQKVYFRTGKQVLQWGRGLFFNPTDVINIDKRSLLDMNASLSMDADREGVYGIKMHIPFGTVVNIYGFLNTGEDVEPDEFAYAGKFEMVYGGSEFAFSAWTKKDYDPIYGFDFSTGIFSMNIFGELSLSTEETVSRVRDNYSVSRVLYTWLPRASVGFNKFFSYGNVENRIILMGEVYYNYAGYSENIFENDAKLMSLFVNELYAPNSLSKWYAMFMGAYREFIRDDINLFVGNMVNAVDTSFVVLTGLNYSCTDNISFDLTAIRMGGPYDSEFGFFLGNSYMIQLVSRWTF